MTLAAGARLGAYDILALIGAGGMGEVYRARDTTLNRDVALKVLPEIVAADPDRLARFTREAQTLAALNHPGIAHVYGLDRHETAGKPPVAFIVMELVEGEDLAQRIARGPIAIDESLSFATQIAEALEAAHDHGIVHRDLKPANIKVRPDGAVKILDFGLAKAIDPASDSGSGPALSMSPTLTSPARLRHGYGEAGATEIGVILGTAAYMAPEQAKGKVVDKRADIWAYGVILYEMLTGRPLFAGESVAETIGLVVTREPDWGALPAATPARVRLLLRRCLTREPRNRLRDIGEARILLASPDEPAAAVTPPSSRQPTMVVTAAAAVTALLAGVTGAALLVRRGAPRNAAPLRRFELPASIAGASVGPILARDGSRFAYIAGNHLRVQTLDALESRDLGAMPVTTENIFWSPDGQSIGFTADATIRTMPAAGGPSFVVSRIPASGVAQDLLWRGDGTIVFLVYRDGIYTVPATGGTPEIFLRLDPDKEVDFHAITEVPGNRFVVTTHLRGDDGQGPNADREQCELLDGGKRTVLTSALNVSGFRYAPPRYLLFARTDANAGVWAVPFADRPLDISKAVRLEAGSTRFSVSDEGTLLASLRSGATAKAELVWVDRAGAATAVPGSSLDMGQGPGPNLALSRDGGRAVFSSGASTDISVRDLATGLDTRLTFERHYYATPSWFPTGDRVLYSSDAAMRRAPAPGGTGMSVLRKAMAQRADGSDRARELAEVSTEPRIAPDGNSLVFIVDDAGSGRLRVAPIAPDGSVGKAQRVFQQNDEPNVRWFDVSRDGRLLAYVTEDPSRRLDIFVTDFPGAAGRWQVRAGGNYPQFSPAGAELFYTRGVTTASGEAKGQFCVVPIASTPAVTVGQEKVLFDLDTDQSPNFGAMGYAVAPDGRRFLAARRLEPAGQTARRAVLVQNWMAALGR